MEMIESGIFHRANNVKKFTSDTIFDFNPNKNNVFNSTEPLWMYDRGKLRRSFEDMKISTFPKPEQKMFQKPNNKTRERSIGKKHKKKKHKFKKCIYKLFKGKRKKHKFLKLKKRIISIFIGFILIKIIFIPIVLKTLALISAKGLMIGLFSTVIASVISLKGMFGHSGHRNRKDDGKTRVEIFHIPGKDENVYYERPFRRNIVINPFNNKL